MLKTTNYQRNMNYNSNEVSPRTCQNDYIKNLQTTSVGDNMEKKEPLHTVGGNVNWYSY